jgi:DNA-directed RNA polymerase specialized sigma24 family protein
VRRHISAGEAGEGHAGAGDPIPERRVRVSSRAEGDGMTTPKNIERLRAMEASEWRSLSLRLTKYARACLQKHWAQAEDVAQDAIADLFDPDIPGWDPEKHPDLFVFLAASVRALAMAQRRGYAETQRRRISEERMEKRGPTVESTEAILARDERAYLIIERIRANMGTKDPKARSVLDLLEAQVFTMAEQAEHMGCTMDEVRSARRRLGTQIEKAKREVDAIRGDGGETKEQFDA